MGQGVFRLFSSLIIVLSMLFSSQAISEMRILQAVAEATAVDEHSAVHDSDHDDDHGHDKTPVAKHHHKKHIHKHRHAPSEPEHTHEHAHHGAVPSSLGLDHIGLTVSANSWSPDHQKSILILVNYEVPVDFTLPSILRPPIS